MLFVNSEDNYMPIWLLILIVLAAAVVVGCIAGLAVGTAQANPNKRKALFSRGEQIVLSAMVLVGIGAILFGVLYTPGTPEPEFWMPGDRDVMFMPDYSGMTIGEDDWTLREDGDFEGEYLPDGEGYGDMDDEEYIAESAVVSNASSPPARPSGGTAAPRPAAQRPGGVVVVR